MPGRDATHAEPATPSEAATRQPTGTIAAPLGDVARAARLQRLVGNRAFVRLLARAVEQRAMVDAGGTTDAAETTGTGHRWVWDPFDHTTTIFMPDTGPNAGGAVQITYEDGTPEELAKLQNAGAERVEGLSPTRAQVMEFLRVKQGTYQESEAGRKAASRPTPARRSATPSPPRSRESSAATSPSTWAA